MNKTLKSLVVFLISLTVISCGSSNNNTTTKSITVKGSLDTGKGSLPKISAIKRGFEPGDTPGCNYDNTSTPTGVSTNLTPSTYAVAMKRFTLLGKEGSGTSDYDLFTADDITTSVVDFTDSTNFYSSTKTLPPAGTYDGFEMELYYIQMGLPDIILPIVSENVSTDANPYNVQMYFETVGNVEKRDFIIQDPRDDSWDWIHPDGDPITPITSTRPSTVIDLFANEEFWTQDPIILSTREAPVSGGMDFSYEGDPIVITASGAYTITLTFDIAETFNFWNWLDDENPTGDGIYDFEHGNCGIHPMLPKVTITTTE